ncbi:flagellin [Roseobacteraceae bacterium S113]
MTLIPISDLARSLVSQSQARLLKADQVQLTQELTTGQVSDPVERTRGDLSTLSFLTREREMQSAYIQNSKEVGQVGDVIQAALTAMSEAAEGMLDTLVIGPQTNLPEVANLARLEAEATMTAVVSTMNVHVAGRHLFAGTAVQTAPLPSPETIFAALDVEVASATTAQDIILAVDQFFAPGGTFETTIYQGSTTDIEAMPLDSRETVDLGIRADSTAIRDLIRSAAMSYVADAAPVQLPLESQQLILEEARNSLVESVSGVTTERTRIGFSQERIEDVLVRLQAAEVETERMRSDILSVDAFETATRLEEVNNRLDLLYATTVRASRLSFLEYMR